MRPAWSSNLALVAAAATLQLCVATAAGAAGAEAAADPSTLLDSVLQESGVAWAGLQHWASAGYERAPALMLGLSVLLAVPALALAGLLVTRKGPSPDVTKRISRPDRGAAEPPRMTTTRADISAWPTEAWVDVEGIPNGRRVIGRSLIRIGREEDNEIHLVANTVHRYHAVIRRTTDGDVVITDLSGSEGNGVLVNGARVAEARLNKGDLINVGEVKLHFDARPI
jgi:hypothetical protein